MGVEIEYITAWAMAMSLLIYVLLGGADFGGGVWDLLAVGPRRRRQRDLIEHAIGPIWEANHVWLIVVVVLMFTCFPPAFAAMGTALHVPLTLVLIGIVFRGASFSFRSYGAGDEQSRRRWGLVFSIASVITPLLLGVTLGAAASGELRWEGDQYVGGFFSPWLEPFPWAVGLFTLAIFAYLAAVYLCVEAKDHALREDFRLRALIAAIAVGAAAWLTWLLVDAGAPTLADGLKRSWWSWPVQIVTGAAALGAIYCLWSRRYVYARASAALQISLIVLAYAAGQFPHLIAPDFTIDNAAAPARTHALVLGALAVGAIILLPSLWWLYRLFKGPQAFAVFRADVAEGTGESE